MDDELRRFLDGLLERHVAITQELIYGIQQGFAQLRAESVAMQAEIADQRQQIQANTEAVLRVLDRLGPDPHAG